MASPVDAKPSEGPAASLVPDPLDTPTLLPLWEHPLGEVFALGHGKGERALQLTVLRAAVASGELAVNQCMDTNALLSEMQSAAIPEIVELRRLGDGRLVLAYDLLEGTTLGQHMLEGALEPERVIAILRQLCRALDVAHGFGIRHGALSLSSVVLVEHEGRDDTVRLLDFGLEDELTVETMEDHEVELQPLSPEKVAGRLPDQREDVYLLGALGYAALAGRPVFQGDAEAVRAAHAERTPDALDCDAALAAVILRCLRKDPSERFADMGAVDDALVRAQELAGLVTAWDDLRPMAGSSASGSHRKSGAGLGGLGRIPSLGVAQPVTGLTPAAKGSPKVERKKTPVPTIAAPKLELPPQVERKETPVPTIAAPKLESKTLESKTLESKTSPSASATFDATEIIEDLRPTADSESSSPPPPPSAKPKGEPSGRHMAVPPPPTLSTSAIPEPPVVGSKGKAHGSGSGFDRAATLGLSLGRSSSEPKRTPSGKFPSTPSLVAKGKTADGKPTPMAAPVAAAAPGGASKAETVAKAFAEPEASEEADTAEQAKPQLAARPTPEASEEADTAEQARPQLAAKPTPEASEEADTAEQARPQLAAKPTPAQPQLLEVEDEGETAERIRPQVTTPKATPAADEDQRATALKATPGVTEGEGGTMPRWLLAAAVVLLIGLPTAWLLTRDEDAIDAAPKPQVAAASSPQTQSPAPSVDPTPTPEPVADPSGLEGQGQTAVASGGTPDPDPRAAGADDGSAVPDEAAEADDGAPPTAHPDATPGNDAPPPAPAVRTPKGKSRELIRAGDRAYASGQIAKAEDRYEAALAEYPRAHAAAAGLGKIAFNKASYDKAATHYGRAVKAAGSNAQYRILYGDALFKQGKLADAKTQYAKAKSLGNKQADGRLAKVKSKLGG